MQDYVSEYMGQRFIEPQSSDLSVVFKESSPVTPLIFVLSAGTDPAADLYKFAEEMRFSKKLSAISLGQGQVGCIHQIFKIQQDFRESGSVVFTTTLIAWSGFNPHPGHVVASFDKTLYDDYLCLVASKKQQIQWKRI